MSSRCGNGLGIRAPLRIFFLASADVAKRRVHVMLLCEWVAVCFDVQIVYRSELEALLRVVVEKTRF